MSLKQYDLQGVITPYISIDEFQPKSGTTQEVIVVGLYADDEDPARDLNTFIQRGAIDVLDTEVSPNPDEQGRHVLFVEFDRNELFPEMFEKFIKDIENVTGKQEWQVKPYLASNAMKLDNEHIYDFIKLTPEEYVTKAEFDTTEVTEIDPQEEVVEAFKHSCLYKIGFNENYVIFNDKIAGRFIAFGDEATMATTLRESAISFEEKSEISILQSLLGDTWNVHNLTEKVAIEHENGDILLVDDIQFIYAR